jgi:phosphoglycolate phosphatase-like HAD superfamily hydrolase
MKKILALDFDGVLCDTIDECLITSINAYRRMNGMQGRVSRMEDVDPEWIKLFRLIRPLVRPAGEYWITAHWLHTYRELLTLENFEELRQKYAGLISDFRTLFFEERAALRSINMQGWIDLHRVFPQAKDGLPDLEDRFNIYFVTNKDKPSIKILSEKLGLNVSESKMFTGEQGRTKPDAIRLIIKENKINAEDVFFVDDQLDHLFDVEKTGVRCFWAPWGYEREPKREHAFTRLNNLRELL